MRNLSPWLGLCHIRKETDDPRSSRKTLVAVWTGSVEGFEREVHFHTNTHGLQMILAEEVLPSDDWLVKHPDRKDAQRLAGKVSAKHPVEIGTLNGAAAAGAQPDDTEGYLHIEEIEGVEPLDSQFGVHPPKTVPDVLYDPLFGQPDPTPAEVAQYGSADKVPPLHTYAILDAAKVVNFVEMLEASGLKHRCLFKGEAAQEMRDVAPYVVRLEEDVDFTRNLFSHDPEQDVPWFMWDRDPGIYVRSRGSLEDMWKHYRKFIRLVDENEKWYYHRFYEDETSNILFQFLRNRRVDAAQWFFVNQRIVVDAVYIRHPYKNSLLCITPNLAELSANDKQGTYRLTQDFRDFARNEREKKNSIKLLEKFRTEIPPNLLPQSNEDLFQRIYLARHVARNYGLTEPILLMKWVMISVFCAPYFWTDKFTNDYLRNRRSNPDKAFADYYAIYKAHHERTGQTWPLP